MKVALANFNHANVIAGGVESRYRLLRRVLEESGHRCVMVSTEQQTHYDILRDTAGCDLLISDSAVCLNLPCPTITIFGNPWKPILDLEPNPALSIVMHLESAWHQYFDSTKIAVSNYIRGLMDAAGQRCDAVIPNPTDASRFNRRAGMPRFYPPTVAWIGPRVAVKNPQAFDAIAESLKDESIQWVELTKYGPGSRRYDEMTDVLSGSSLVLCTSWYEGCSNTLMEALAADTPIVTTRSGYFWDTWDDRFGIRVDDASCTPAFTDAIRTVLSDPSRFSPRQAALDHGLGYDVWAACWLEAIAYATGGHKHVGP